VDRRGSVELNSSYFLACYYLREMRRYNWGRVVVRIALASALAAFYAVAAHSGRSVWPPRICNGGFADAIEFVLGLSAAMLVIEGLHWGTWWMRQLSNVSRAKSQKSVDDSPSTGGRLFAPLGGISSVLLAAIVLDAVRAYIGALTPCESLDPHSVSRRMIMGAIFQAYGVLLIAEALLTKFPRR
jgi:hypothetical protein